MALKTGANPEVVSDTPERAMSGRITGTDEGPTGSDTESLLPNARPGGGDGGITGAHVTVITAQSPRRLSKGFRLDGDDLVKLPGGNLVSGSIEYGTIATLADLSRLLKSLTPAQALIYGKPRNSAQRLITRKAFAAAGHSEGVTTRTKEAFTWPSGAGVLMLDYDPCADGVALDRDDLVGKIRTAVPGLASAAMLWWPSASSCIYAGAQELRGVKGQRLYIIVTDATDIPRAGKVLVDRLWLSGHGHIEISGSGAMLERTLIDASVWQPSRLDFAGGADCGPGLEQRRGDPAIIEGTAERLDTRAALPALGSDELARLAQIKADAKRAAASEAERAKEKWVEERVQEMLAPETCIDPEARRAAAGSARQALERGVLGGDFLVPVEVHGEVEMVAVAALLDDRDRYHGALTRDPVEPDYDGGRLVGRLFLMQAGPVLHSFAHGGRTYKLHRAPARVELVKGHTAEAATATIDLLRHDPVTFDFGGQLVVADNGRLHPLCEHGLAHHLGTVTQFWKARPSGDGMKPVDCDPPAALLKQILAHGERRQLKPLEAVITGPTIRLDGTLLSEPGYDSVTRLLFDPVGEEVPVVPLQPNQNEAAEALERLLEPFRSFPFVDAAARGALLAALLTAAVRPILPTAPAFAFDAPIQGSGKTLLASCVGALTNGRTPDIWPHTQGRDDEEVRKRLFTALRTGSRALVWDNVTGVMDSASMAAFITSEAIVDRVLGRSESIRIPNRALLILTGNNLSLAGDLPRRVITCRIDPQTDEPFARQFGLDPLAHTLDNRIEMLAAACTLIRARFTHLDTPALGRLASFEAWDHLVRQTVVWANRVLRPGAFGDPMDLVRAAQAADPAADALFALLAALHECFGREEFSAKDVMRQMGRDFSQTPIQIAVADLAGDRAVRSARSLGRVLQFREGRIVNGLRLTSRQDSSAGARIYRVSRTDETPNG
ncbi:hypothetical protein [Rhodovulum marinum]|uniref:Uncharacterized protein n=1 Tax=Rhodovulum marinum TaxID=320662 RepID=A0A4R2PYK9_9RHOB|nr:hypothetical protein [Rhodovulum marinum]TCP41352.1 hypothetical protein EV662_10598 [Rhodovulum marinum]